MLRLVMKYRIYWSFKMLCINVICVGSLKESYLKDAVKEYTKRLTRFCKFVITEIDESTLLKEGEQILKNCKGYKVALCVEGEQMTSEELSGKIANVSLTNSVITWIIGSSTGLNQNVKDAADLRLSFSNMTFPHQLMRVILLEQLYRAFTIINHVKYHK